MELYTSLVRLKQAMNGGHMPPMTPLPDESAKILDPAFTIGLGAFSEDRERGLRCPVRECGVWRHRMKPHLDRHHADIGGSSQVLKLLSIPTTVSLCSQSLSEKARERALDQGLGVFVRSDHPRRLTRMGTIKRRRTIQSNASTAGKRNLQNSCMAQLSHALIDLQHRIGRSPTYDEAAQILGDAFPQRVKKVFGSWNSAKAQCGLEVYTTVKRSEKDTQRKEQVLHALCAWYDEHGTLPSSTVAKRGRSTPVLPVEKTILRAMGTLSWPEAMRRAASILNIYGGRYGLPERKDAAA